MDKEHNKDGRINFGMYYINDIYKWGYEAVDTINKETLKCGYNYESLETARKAGFEEAKKIIHELEAHEQWVKDGCKDE